ncbi:hypothetical protein A1359_17450 [Methylomonas lenta]|uniref:Uncharacterized protein n=1 Tax=Methylomonas lenta TaxID=980561 RepID=A0A177MX81_9GAMM|nr:VanZ family protein [Methylomonas lenta]OAI09994.1 hypothetical protein A1359_17450 [Methylomonas lenta]
MRKTYLVAFIACFLFVIYGSLVPLEYKALDFSIAFERFKNIKYLSLGIESRADWIANILLYIPLSFLALGTFRISLKKGWLYIVFSTVLVFLFCLATAISVEFAQQFFPPRTVSLNDLIAETLGTVLGIVFWFGMGEKFLGYFNQIGQGDWLSIKSAILLFLPGYIFLSLFPFDFVTSMGEMDNKLAGGHDTFFIDIDACRTAPFRCIVKWMVEILILVPLGALFAALPYTPNKKSLAVVVGFLLGVFIELTQVFIYSGSGQGFSIITRMLGMAVGVQAYVFFAGRDLQTLRPWLGRFVWLALLPYILAVAAINGWLEGGWLSIAAAQQKLNETQFLPFYYFYYTTETVALVSLLSNIGTYMPVGFLFWIMSLRSPDQQKIHGFWVGLSAAVFAVIIETGKLFLQAKHVDPTDVLIAFVSGAVTYAALNSIQKMMSQSGRAGLKGHAHLKSREEIVDSIAADASASDLVPVQKKWLLPAGFICLLVLYQIIQYPLKPALLALCVIGYCYGLVRKPLIGLFVLPALLPIMDFAPWTGRFFFDEFDLMVLSTLMVMMLLPSGKSGGFPNFRISDMFYIGLFLLLLGVSLVIGLMPLPEIDANSFSNYYSNYNALRIVKGFFWGLLLSPYLIHFLRERSGQSYFSAGLISGLAAVAIFSIFERWVFPGLFDFSTDYRINALFASMHNGGGHIESYLALSMPFVATLFLAEKHLMAARVGGVLLFVLSLYALLMTFSRGGAIGLSVSCFVLLIGLYVHFASQSKIKLKQSAGLVALLLVVVATLSLPVFEGDLMKNRLSVAGKDSETRHRHWSAAVDAMDGDVLTQLFGMGLGSFPRTFFWSNQENAHPATYRIGSEKGNQYLALQGGDALFMGQYVSLQPHQSIKLSIEVRSLQQNVWLSIPICEKSLQYSFRCVVTEVYVPSAQWQKIEKDIQIGGVGAVSDDIAGGWLARPVQLALYAGGDTGVIVEVDNLQLLDAKGQKLISNGDFSAGLDHWYFSTEKHNPWHIFNIWVHVLFDMGWLGLVAFISLILYVYYRLIKSLRQDIYAPILLASFTGFLIIGYVDSPFDAPRLTFLFCVLVIFAIFGCKRPHKSFRVFK